MRFLFPKGVRYMYSQYLNEEIIHKSFLLIESEEIYEQLMNKPHSKFPRKSKDKLSDLQNLVDTNNNNQNEQKIFDTIDSLKNDITAGDIKDSNVQEMLQNYLDSVDVEESTDYDDEQGEVPGEQDTGPDEYEEEGNQKDDEELEEAEENEEDENGEEEKEDESIPKKGKLVDEETEDENDDEEFDEWFEEEMKRHQFDEGIFDGVKSFVGTIKDIGAGAKAGKEAKRGGKGLGDVLSIAGNTINQNKFNRAYKEMILGFHKGLKIMNPKLQSKLANSEKLNNSLNEIFAQVITSLGQGKLLRVEKATEKATQSTKSQTNTQQ